MAGRRFGGGDGGGADCGAESPLVALARHVVQDSASPAHQRALLRPAPQAGGGPQQSVRPQPHRPFVSGAEAEQLFQHAYGETMGRMAEMDLRRAAQDEWLREFGTGPPPDAGLVSAAGPAPHLTSGLLRHPLRPPMSRMMHGPHSMLMQQHRPVPAATVAEGPTSWADSFLQEDAATAAAPDTTAQPVHPAHDAMQRTAEQLLAQSEGDEKLRGSSFMQFVDQLRTGDLHIDEQGDVQQGPAEGGQAAAFEAQSSGQRADAWAREFGHDPAWLQNSEDMTALEDDYRRLLLAQELDTAGAEPGLHDPHHVHTDTPQAEAAPATSAAAVSKFGYRFQTENPLLASTGSYDELLAAGREALEQSALLHAILNFEAAVQKDMARADGWFHLGVSQAENEQDDSAICALRECVDISPAHSEAHLALAVSLTNEFRTLEACEALETAVRGRADYEARLPPRTATRPQGEASGGYQSVMDSVKDVRDLCIRATQLSQDVDADVQIALGIIFNMRNEYDLAVDCFSTALSARPDDCRLWNKLGATLANGNRSAEAVDAYRRALELRPGYIRARYNMGISCVNLKSYQEAVEHFLKALSLQQAHSATATRHNMSDTIWHSLRMALYMHNEPELASLTTRRDLSAFKGKFEF